MDATKPLTPRQQTVLDAINAHWREDFRSPTVRELCQRLGLSSPNGVHNHLIALRKRGHLIEREGQSSRGLLTQTVRDHLAKLS